MRIGLLPVALSLWAAAAAQQDFSHAAHLKLPAKLTCVTCHASVQSSAKLEDNNLPLKQICLSCHKEANIKEANIKAPARTLLSRFNHRKHLEMGNLAPAIRSAIDSKTYLSPVGEIRRHLNGTNPCAACHRGMEESNHVTKAAFPQMADCLVCHSKIDAPFSCEFCHAKGANLKPASHTPGYLDAHNRKNANLDKASCVVCHGRTFTCLGCHQ